MYRVGLVGCGRIGADINPSGVGSSRLGSHAAACRASTRVTLVAACDPDESRRLEAQRRWQIPAVYASLDAMLEAGQLDLAIVATPAVGRPAVLTTLVQSGRVHAVLAEKPIASSVIAAEAMEVLAAEHSVIGAVNYVRRFAPGYRSVIADIHAGAIGTVQTMRGVYTKGVLNNGGHLLDLMRWVGGDGMTTTVTAAMAGLPDDPTVSATVSWPGGLCGTMTGLSHEAFTIFELDVIGTEGRVTFGDLGHRVDRWAVEDTRARFGFRQLGPAMTSDPALTSALSGALDNLADCLDGTATPHCTFADGRAALGLALTVRRQAHDAFPELAE